MCLSSAGSWVRTVRNLQNRVILSMRMVWKDAKLACCSMYDVLRRWLGLGRSVFKRSPQWSFLLKMNRERSRENWSITNNEWSTIPLNIIFIKWNNGPCCGVLNLFYNANSVDCLVDNSFLVIVSFKNYHPPLLLQVFSSLTKGCPSCQVCCWTLRGSHARLKQESKLKTNLG